jgi:hypothetical protein
MPPTYLTPLAERIEPKPPRLPMTQLSHPGGTKQDAQTWAVWAPIVGAVTLHQCRARVARHPGRGYLGLFRNG